MTSQKKLPHRRSYQNGYEIFAQHKNVFLIILKNNCIIIITALKKTICIYSIGITIFEIPFRNI